MNGSDMHCSRLPNSATIKNLDRPDSLNPDCSHLQPNPPPSHVSRAGKTGNQDLTISPNVLSKSDVVQGLRLCWRCNLDQRNKLGRHFMPNSEPTH